MRSPVHCVRRFQFWLERLQALVRPAHHAGFERDVEPAEDGVAGVLHDCAQCVARAAALRRRHRHQGPADPQRRARRLRPLPLGRFAQRLARKVGAAGTHLLARMRELQLDHPFAHRDVDRIDRQHLPREADRPLVGVARHGCVNRVQQHRDIAGKPLHRLLRRAVPLLRIVIGAVALQQIQRGGQVFRIGGDAALQVVGNRIPIRVAPNVGVLQGESGQVTKHDGLRASRACGVFSSAKTLAAARQWCGTLSQSPFASAASASVRLRSSAASVPNRRSNSGMRFHVGLIGHDNIPRSGTRKNNAGRLL